MRRRTFCRQALGGALALPLVAPRLLAAGGAAGAAKPGFFARHQLPIGVQLYTLGPELANDLPGMLAALRQMGCETVETADLLGRTPAEFRAALDVAGLRCTSMHIAGMPLGPGPGLSLSGDLAALAAAAHTLGATDIVMPIFLFPQDFKPPATSDMLALLAGAGAALTADDYRRMADFLNEKARLLKAEGLRLAYHNHNPEFRPLPGGATGYELLLRHTDRRLVGFEMDAGWVSAAGRDPLQLLRAWPGRFTAMHVKDIKGSTTTNYEFRQVPTEVGAGIINWPQILPVALAQGVKQFYVEQEPPFPGPRIDSVGKSVRYLQRLPA